VEIAYSNNGLSKAVFSQLKILAAGARKVASLCNTSSAFFIYSNTAAIKQAVA
jgi:hypothetical protein